MRIAARSRSDLGDTEGNEFEAAATHLRELAHREPNNQEVWYLLGKVHAQLSEQALARMNAIDPNSVLVHEMSGEIMESMKNYDGALNEYSGGWNPFIFCSSFRGFLSGKHPPMA